MLPDAVTGNCPHKKDVTTTPSTCNPGSSVFVLEPTLALFAVLASVIETLAKLILGLSGQLQTLRAERQKDISRHAGKKTCQQY